MNKGSDSILIVEDDYFLSKVLSARLKEEGFDVELAENGKVALDKLYKNDYSLILLDILMPIMSGYGLLEKLQELKSDVPVLVLTNLAQVHELAKAKELGAKDCWIKSSIGIGEIADKVRRILGEISPPLEEA